MPETSVCCCRRLRVANPQIFSLLCIPWKVEKTFPEGTRVVKHKGSWRGSRAPLELEQSPETSPEFPPGVHRG